MPSNLDRYRKDLDSLIETGQNLYHAIQAECFPEAFKREVGRVADKNKEIAKEMMKGVPSFKNTYQLWYSEAKVLIKQLLPDRLTDFAGHYEKPKGRKTITHENYKIEDYLQGLRVTRTQGYAETLLAGPNSAIPQFEQQFAILKSVQSRFQSSLFDIRQLVQADLFDSELDAARELAKSGFYRAAGALAGVVLERHLAQVCQNHAIALSKKSPAISDLNDALKSAGTVDVPTWRLIQHLADIRNLCDHSKKTDPTPQQVEDLVTGVDKMTKTLF